MKKLITITALVLTILALFPGCQRESSSLQPEESAVQLSLEIRSPRDGEESRRTPIRISGTVSHPEAEVAANGVKAEVEANGFFTTDWVPLEEGKNKIKVRIRLKLLPSWVMRKSAKRSR